jgi:type I restriction enzyme S subunit
MNLKTPFKEIGVISTGKYDVNHSSENGRYPFFTCAMGQFRSDTFSFDDEAIILPGNGANVGQVFYYSGPFEAYQRTYVLHKIKADVKYVYHFFKGFWAKSLIGQQFGSATNYIRYNNIAEFAIPIPPLETQKKIAAILDKADELRQNDKKILEKYDQLAQSVFLEMFGDPVRNQKGFELCTIRDLVNEVKYGTSAKASDKGNYPYLRMSNITYEGYWDLSSLKYINIPEKDKDKYLVRKGDILFNRTNSKELVGKTAVYSLNNEMAIAGYLIRVRINSLANPYYLWGYLNSKHGKLTLENMCKNIVGMANINAQELQNIPLLKPPIELQNRFAEIIKRIEEQKIITHKSLQKSEELFQSLLQRAFRGELA